MLLFLAILASNFLYLKIGYKAGVKDICRQIDKSLEELKKQQDESGNDKENATM